MATDHTWTFFRAGGVDQVVLEDGADLTNLTELDQKLWVALACPTKGNEIDARSLDLVDSDHDGRIRPPEILEAIAWSAKVLKSLDVFFEKGDSLALECFNVEASDGKAVLASAKRILNDQGKGDAKEIDLDDALAVSKAFAATRFNGDGVVPADSSDDEGIKLAIDQIAGCVGSIEDRSGKPGIDQARLDKFFEQATALLAWKAESAKEGVLPLGEATAAAADAVRDVEVKIVDYFTRTRLAAFDARVIPSLNAAELELAGLSTTTISPLAREVTRLPLARVEAGRALPLESTVNPAWATPLAQFRKVAATPLLGSSGATLSESDFETILRKLEPYRAWQAGKPAATVESLGYDRLRELVEGGTRAAILELIEKDRSLEEEYQQIASVEKILRLRRDLVRLLRNFVNFAEFYGRRGAMFQAGTLYLDARSCDLCMYVDDPGRHATLAGLSKAYLAYCDISRLSGEKHRIVAAFTAGDVDNIMVGRNGVFYDRKGNDWDATITSLVENPISVRQAFWSPYKRLIRLIEEQMAKRAADKEKESTAHVDSAAAGAVPPAAPPAPGAPAPAPASPAVAPAPVVPVPAVVAPAAAAVPGAPVDPAAPPPAAPLLGGGKFDIGLIVGIGVAVGTVAAFLTSVLAMFLGLGLWMPVGIAGLLLAISGPSMLIAWLKLRQRNLGPILDASGWAVNGLAKINVPFGGSLTAIASLPKGASRTLVDPFAEKRSPWKLYLMLGIIVALFGLWLFGISDDAFHVPQHLRFKNVIKQQ